MASSGNHRHSPFESLKELKALLDNALEEARSRKRKDDEKGGEVEGPSVLASAYDRLRLWAFPNDRADWAALDRARAHRERMDKRHAESLFALLGRWEFLGPRAFDTGGGHYTSGRVNDIAIDPRDSQTIYAGAAGGGVWKTIDNGITWKPLSDTWPMMEISSVAIDPTNSSVIYAGTGDFDDWGQHHFGVMKSTDGGVTFSLLPVGEAAQVSITGIVVDPDNPLIVTICGGHGGVAGRVWRSTDGGSTWARASSITADWMKLVISKADGGGVRAMYVVGWSDDFRTGVSYRSLDRGATWHLIKPPFVADQSELSVAASPLTPEVVYVAGSVDRKVFKSFDHGDTWNDVTHDLRQDDFEWNQSWYDFDLACGAIGTDSAPRDILYIGLKHLSSWDSSGITWKELPHGHDDLHVLAIDPTRPGRGVLIGNDGGVYEQERVAHGWDLSSRNATLGVTQCYRGDASPFDARICIAGTQDNAVASSQTDLRAWGQLFPPSGGDAIAALVNPANQKIQFIEAGVAFHGIARTADQWKTSKEITPSTPGDVLDAFSMPMAMDAGGTRLYWASDYLWVRDEASGVWAGRLGAQQLAGTGNGVRSLAVAESDPLRVYTGSTDGQIWMADGPGFVWKRIDESLPKTVISAIAVHPRNKNDILVAIGGTGTGHVFHCADTTATPPVWDDVSAGGVLPDLPAVGVVRDSVFPDSRFYAALDVGVFYTEDAGKHWTDITVPLGLPNVQLQDLRLAGNIVYAFTYGRGAWWLNPTGQP